ncbi:MAG: serine hydroxymethyltransferase [Candidatus Micrarchaeota archaeon]|nr:serine hydroxymethyltransferase [Candidatus Micrarchaeota archaeon]
MLADLRQSDPDVANAIHGELRRIQSGIELIASENFVSKAVMQANGSVFTNKYSEGTPHKRYYGGNEWVDVVEDLAVERAKKLFGADHVNVQPLSGSPANQAAFFALMEAGDKFMGLSLAHGGHLTHGASVNFSGKLFKAVPYGVSKETELLDYDEIRRIALAEKPKMILSGLTAYPRKLDFKAFKEIADEVGARTMSDVAHIAGLIAAGLHENPCPVTDIVTTTTHKTLRGPRGAIIMCKQEFAEKVDKCVFPFLQGGPHDQTTAAKAVAFGEALKPEFKEYAKQVMKNAKALGDELMARGLRLVTGGTDNHLLLVDLTPKGISGKEAEKALGDVHIYVNKNMIPFDPRKPFDPSGIRVGTPASTTRGFGESEMKVIGECIAAIVEKPGDEAVKEKVKGDVAELCRRFPLYPGMELLS